MLLKGDTVYVNSKKLSLKKKKIADQMIAILNGFKNPDAGMCFAYLITKELIHNLSFHR